MARAGSRPRTPRDAQRLRARSLRSVSAANARITAAASSRTGLGGSGSGVPGSTSNACKVASRMRAGTASTASGTKPGASAAIQPATSNTIVGGAIASVASTPLGDHSPRRAHTKGSVARTAAIEAARAPATEAPARARKARR